jgi:hypothetical protein
MSINVADLQYIPSEGQNHHCWYSNPWHHSSTTLLPHHDTSMVDHQSYKSMDAF